MQLQSGGIFAGRYKLLEQIRTADFAEVWKAADQRMEDCEVALKIYATEEGYDNQELKMFARDFASVSDLNHPHLWTARYFDIQEGVPFAIMPYAKYTSLQETLIENGKLGEKGIAEVVLQIGGALSYLHAADKSHTNLTPDNILRDSEGKYLLTDFEISPELAIRMEKLAESSQELSRAYAPPESFDSKAPLSAEANIFSFGAMIYAMATGNVPWMGGGGTRLKPDSPPLELPKGYSEELEAVLQKCVSFDPADRPTAGDLVLAAKGFLENGFWALEADSSKSMKVHTSDITQESTAPTKNAESSEEETSTKSEESSFASNLLALVALLWFLS